MQKKLAAGFLLVALLYVLIAVGVPRLSLVPLWQIVLMISLDLVLGLGAAWVISRRMTRRMRDLAAAAGQISRGDLATRIDTAGDDEIAEVAQAFEVMTHSLADIVHEVRSTADRIHALSHELSGSAREINARTLEIAETSAEIARGTGRQAEQVSRTNAVTRELSGVAEGVARRTGNLHASASEAADRAARGAEDARKAADGLGNLTRTNASATRAVQGFREKSEEIGKAINSITSIAHQTHLLAINAAIEAARSGEEGRGFGVVAEEVGRVADSVRGFAEQILKLSEEILLGSNLAAEQIGRTARAAEQAGERVERSLASFEGILAAVRGTAADAGEILQLTRQHRTAAEQAALGLQGISEIAERNVEGTEDASAATREQTEATDAMAATSAKLTHGADQLSQAVSVFRLPDTPHGARK